jgi:hypothetical protein
MAHAVVRDVVHVAMMLNNDLTRIATFDAGFDRFDGISRIALASRGGTQPGTKYFMGQRTAASAGR